MTETCMKEAAGMAGYYVLSGADTGDGLGESDHLQMMIADARSPHRALIKLFLSHSWNLGCHSAVLRIRQ